jgi:hypothetical protein
MKIDNYLIKIKIIPKVLPIQSLKKNFLFKKSTIFPPYNNIDYWNKSHNISNIIVIRNLFKGLAWYNKLISNKLIIQISYTTTNLFIDNFFLLNTNTTNTTNTTKNTKNTKNTNKETSLLELEILKQSLIKASFSILKFIKCKTLNIYFYQNLLNITTDTTIALKIFKKDKYEPYFIRTILTVEKVFKTEAGSEMIANLIKAYTQRNPRRVYFLSFLRRIIEWYFLVLSKKKVDGVRTEIKGRFNAKSRARKQILSVGKIKKFDIVDYNQMVAVTKFGSLSIKVWICPRDNQ